MGMEKPMKQMMDQLSMQFEMVKVMLEGKARMVTLKIKTIYTHTQIHTILSTYCELVLC